MITLGLNTEDLTLNNLNVYNLWIRLNPCISELISPGITLMATVTGEQL